MDALPFAESPELSVVVPLYNEAENLPVLYDRLVRSLQSAVSSFELVLVDDGSIDAGPAAMDRLQANDPRVRVIRLSRNFGHQAAVSAGLDHARGRAVIVMDGDLQDPPEVLIHFLNAWREGYEVVYAVRRNRKESAFKRAGYFLFYRLLRSISDLDIPLDSGDFCLMDRKVVDVLTRLPERSRFVRGLRTFVGFRQVGLAYERDARAAGQPKYGFRALVRLAADGLIGFSGRPLQAATWFGVLSVLAALGLSVWVLFDFLIAGNAPQGWTFLAILVLFMHSLTLFSLGIVGEYIRRILIEVKGRPTYIVRETAAASQNDVQLGRTRIGVNDGWSPRLSDFRVTVVKSDSP